MYIYYADHIHIYRSIYIYLDLSPDAAAHKTNTDTYRVSPLRSGVYVTGYGYYF